MPTLIKREAAKRDLQLQWLWYAETGSVALAERFLVAVKASLDLLAANPLSGSPTLVMQKRPPGVRRFPVGDGFGRIFLYYIPRAGSLELVRVIHSARDARQLPM